MLRYMRRCYFDELLRCYAIAMMLISPAPLLTLRYVAYVSLLARTPHATLRYIETLRDMLLIFHDIMR